MNLLSEQLQCPVRWIRGEGVGEKAADVILSSEVRQVQKWQLAQKEKSADFRSTDLGRSAYTLINYQQTLTQINFVFLFAATADVYRNQGNEAFKKGDFINAIHFYTKGIKMNCNEKELKAKLYNNRAIAHSKLGKMI